MKNSFFDKWEFKKALDIGYKNPFEADLKFEEYFKKYPKDYSGYSYYISNLIKIKKLDKAEQIIKYIENKANNDQDLINNKERYKRFKQNLLYSKFKLLMYQEKYQEFNKLYYQNIELAKKLDINHLLFLSKIKAGQINIRTRDSYYYIQRQFINYNYEDFLNHLKDHTIDIYNYIDYTNNSIFENDFPLDKILIEIQKYIPSEKCLYTGFIEDTYVFRYEVCGRQNNKTENYFKVLCFHNTSNIITMYPSSNCEELEYIDLNYLTKTNNNKIKKKSRIDRFYDRYK